MIYIPCSEIPEWVRRGDLPATFTDACVVARHENVCIVDEACHTPTAHGPGTELKALLAGWPFYIVSTPDCKCSQRARYMDEKGCDWCESPEGMTEILGFLREAAEERGLPFLDLPARLLVRRAISNARKAEARRAREAEAAKETPPAV